MSQHPPTVSVLLPAFNAEAFIREAIESWLNQTFTDFEMIISDNASEDRTGEICREYAEKDQRIQYSRNPVNIGALANGRKLLSLARGFYTLGAADHDIWRRDLLEHYLKEFQEDPKTILVYSPETIISATGDMIDINKPDAPVDVGKFSTFYNVFSGGINSQAMCGLYRRNDFYKTSAHTSLGTDTIQMAEFSLYGNFRQLKESHFFRRQNRPPESPRESAARYITMLFEHPPEIIKAAPYVHMVYKSLCMIQNNDLIFEDQRLLNSYILYIFIRNWGVTVDHLVAVLRYMDEHPQTPAAQTPDLPAAGQSRFKPERMMLDMDLFLKTLAGTSYVEIARRYTSRTLAAASPNHSVLPARKWATPKPYDVCYLLYDAGKWGGVMFILALANGLAGRGYRVCLVSRTPMPDWADILTDYIVSPDLSVNDIPPSDIIIGTWYPTVPVAVACGKGVAVHFSQGYEGLAPEIPADQKSTVDGVYRLPTVKLANSAHVAALIEERFPGKVYLVQNDLDHAVFYPAQTRTWGKGSIRVLIVGPYEFPGKGIRECLNACKIFADAEDGPVEIIRVSQTPQLAEEIQLVQDNGCACEYHFNLSETQMAALYNDCDIFLSGAYPHGDSFGRPVMEALACGLPAVITDIPAYRDYDAVTDYALFVPPGDSKGMAAAMQKIARSPELRRRLMDRGIVVSGKYALDKTLDQLEEALTDIRGSAAQESARQQYYGYARPEVQEMVSSKARKILDVGCASGLLASQLKDRLKAEVWGIEVVENVARQAEEKLDRVIARPVEDALPELPEYHFDAVILADVLEHLQEPGPVLANLRSKLTVSGEIVASIPNVRHWSVLKELLEGKWEYRDAGILDRTHLRFFTKSSIVQLFASAGYEIKEMKATSIPGEEVPSEVVQTLARAKLDVATLAEEGAHYQYLVRARVRKDVKNIVSIIMLTFNQLEYTQKCVQSLRTHTPEPYEIIFVDNGSTDGTVKWLQEQVRNHPQDKLIANSKNLGFARGCNQGMAVAEGEYLLLLNNDVVVAEGWLAGLMDCLNQAPNAGLVGPMTNSISGPQQVCDPSYRSVDDLDAYAADFNRRFRGRRLPFRRMVGYCMLFKRTLAEQIGGLDESFGTGNFEDDDFCVRSTLEGYQNYIAGDVFIHHFRNISFIGNKIDYGAMMSGNRTLMEKKWTLNSATPEGRKLAVLKATELAEELYFKGEADRAVAALVDCIKIAPDAAKIYTDMARIFLETKRFGEAWAALEAMPEAAKSDMQSLEYAGFAKEGLGEDDEAANYVRKMLALNANHAPALNLRGVLNFKKEEKARAGEWFEKAVQADAGYGEGHTNLGVLCWGLEQNEKALVYLRKGFNLSPTSPDAASLYHSVVSAMERYEDAEADFYAAVQLYPDHRHLLFLYIDLLIRQEKFASAMPAIEEALEKFGIDAEAMAAALAIREKVGPRRISSAAGNNTLSLCMIVKNEEKNLLKCLRSVRDVVDEMIIVDTGSTDQTKDIARVFGAGIFDFPWTGDFSAARNFSLAQAKGDWILVLDADETLSVLDYRELQSLIHRKVPSPAAYSLVTRNYITNSSVIGWKPSDGKYPDQSGLGWMESAKVRLFPRSKNVRFVNPVHEIVEPSLTQAGIPVYNCSVAVHHYGKLDLNREAEKGREYYELGKTKYESDPANVKYINELARQAHLLGKYEEAKDLWLKLLGILEADPQSPGFAAIARVTEGDPLSDIQTQLAAAYLALNQFDEALKAARKSMVAEARPAGRVYFYALAEILAGSKDAASKELESVLAQAPDYAPGLFLKAVICTLKNKRETAGRLFTILQEMQFDLLTARMNHLTGQLRSAGKTAEAMHLSAAAIEYKIGDEETRRLYGALQSESGVTRTGL